MKSEIAAGSACELGVGLNRVCSATIDGFPSVVGRDTRVLPGRIRPVNTIVNETAGLRSKTVVLVNVSVTAPGIGGGRRDVELSLYMSDTDVVLNFGVVDSEIPPDDYSSRIVGSRAVEHVVVDPVTGGFVSVVGKLDLVVAVVVDHIVVDVVVAAAVFYPYPVTIVAVHPVVSDDRTVDACVKPNSATRCGPFHSGAVIVNKVALHDQLGAGNCSSFDAGGPDVLNWIGSRVYSRTQPTVVVDRVSPKDNSVGAITRIQAVTATVRNISVCKGHIADAPSRLTTEETCRERRTHVHGVEGQIVGITMYVNPVCTRLINVKRAEVVVVSSVDINPIASDTCSDRHARCVRVTRFVAHIKHAAGPDPLVIQQGALVGAFDQPGSTDKHLGRLRG